MILDVCLYMHLHLLSFNQSKKKKNIKNLTNNQKRNIRSEDFKFQTFYAMNFSSEKEKKKWLYWNEI